MRFKKEETSIEGRYLQSKDLLLLHELEGKKFKPPKFLFSLFNH
jgi:hypothetical protein